MLRTTFSLILFCFISFCFFSRFPCPHSSVNYFSFMVIKLVLAQIQFITVLIVASVVMLPFVVGAALLLWWHNLYEVSIPPMHAWVPPLVRTIYFQFGPFHLSICTRPPPTHSLRGNYESMVAFYVRLGALYFGCSGTPTSVILDAPSPLTDGHSNEPLGSCGTCACFIGVVRQDVLRRKGGS